MDIIVMVRTCTLFVWECIFCTPRLNILSVFRTEVWNILVLFLRSDVYRVLNIELSNKACSSMLSFLYSTVQLQSVLHWSFVSNQVHTSLLTTETWWHKKDVMSLCLQREHPDIQTLRSLGNHDGDTEDNFKINLYFPYESCDAMKSKHFQNYRKTNPGTQR